MKKLLLVSLVAVLGAGSAQAQAYRSPVLQGAVLGGATGAVIGHNSGRHTGQGAVIGALAGALIGTAVDNRSTRTVVTEHRTVVYTQPAYVACAPAPQVVYVQSAPVYYAPPCPPPARVIVYQDYGYVNHGYRRPVVYVNTGRDRHFHGRWSAPGRR